MQAIVTTRKARTRPWNSGSNRQRPMPITKKVTAQIEFSMALPRKCLVSTAYQEKHSAITISGTITAAAFSVVSAPVMVPSCCRKIAHCAAKAISATVATLRPTVTLESQVSNRQMRWISARGRKERKAQPNT